MTKEEILDYFKDVNHAYNDCTRYDTLKRMLDELQELCEDAISRQEAINVVICDVLSSAIVYGRTEEGMSARKAIVDGLRRLPPVTPSEKVGKWIIYDVHGHKACKCSECNNDVGYPCTDKYCKYCGAKMQEDNNGRIIQTDNTNYEGCMLVNNCNYKTATCYVCEPDDGCYPYRYIKKIIEKENVKMEVQSE